MPGPEASRPFEFVNPSPGLFQTTHWSVVLGAQEADSPAGQESLAQLCRQYWPPVYVFIRRRGHSPHDAEDLTQEFFYRLLHKHQLEVVDPRKGRFRTFLLAVLQHFLANEWRHARAQRRGGGRALISLDQLPDFDLSLEPAPGLTPEQAYERQWSLTLLSRVIERLRAEHHAAGLALRFEALKGFLGGDQPESTYAELARKLGTSEGALKMSVSRLRRRYLELLREEVAGLVANPADVVAELRALLIALARGGP